MFDKDLPVMKLEETVSTHRVIEHAFDRITLALSIESSGHSIFRISTFASWSPTLFAVEMIDFPSITS